MAMRCGVKRCESETPRRQMACSIAFSSPTRSLCIPVSVIAISVGLKSGAVCAPCLNSASIAPFSASHGMSANAWKTSAVSRGVNS
eukprot:2982192-Rhodomonas_salina.4